MQCPICKKEVALTDPHMPFCGERCQLIDLGNWATDKYVIPSPLPPGQEAENGEAEDGVE